MKLNKLFLVAAISAASTLVHAADLTWDTTGGDSIVTGGAGTWDTTLTRWTTDGGANNVAWVNANNDTAIFGGTAGAVGLSTGITAGGLTFNTTGYSITGNTLTLAGTPIITTGTGVTATISSNLAGTAGFTKNGAGTLTINTATANTLSGSIAVNEGTLIFDYANSASNTAKVATTSTLALGGGTFQVLGKSSGFTTVQNFAGLVINSGSSNAVSTPTGGATTGINYGTITRPGIGGTVNFSGNGLHQTNGVTNTNGIIGGYATFNGNTWVVGTATFGNLTGLAAFSTNIMSAGTQNVDVTTSFTATGNAANSVRFNNAGARTLTLQAGAATTITTGGILVTSAVGNNASLITGGTSLAGAAGKDLIVHQHNTANTLTIATAIVDNTTATGLTKSGAGTLIISGANTYTGVTTVNTGNLSVSGSAMVASGSNGVSIASGATLAVSGTLKLVSNTSQIANSGTFDLSSGTDVLDLNGQITGLTNGSTYNLLSTVGAITGNFDSITGYDTTNFTASFNNTNGIITFTAVPEPSTYGLIGAGALAGVAFVRRRRKHAGKIAA